LGESVWLFYPGVELQRHGIRIGNPETFRVCHAFLIQWGLMAVVTIAMAIAALPMP